MRYKVIKECPQYEIYEDGTVWRRKHRSISGSQLSRKQIIPYKARNKYLIVCLHDTNGKRVQRYLHRLVYEAFFGSIPKGFEIDHIDGSRQNCHVQNLRLSTHKANTNNPKSIERYKVSNALDKGKFNRDRLIAAQGKEAFERACKVYWGLLDKHGSCGIWMLMKEAHVGYQRALKVIGEMREKADRMEVPTN